MAIVPPPTGSTGEAASFTIQRQPPEEYSSAIFGWGGFVNFVDPDDSDVAQTVENVFNTTGLGQNRQEYPTGSPTDTHESWALGRLLASQVIVECWLSKRDDATNAQVRLLNAHEADEDVAFAVGLGDQFVYTFDAKVKGFSLEASIESPVRLQLVLRPSGTLTRGRVLTT